MANALPSAGHPTMSDGCGAQTPTSISSQLCKPLDVVLREPSTFSVLNYFIQYMDSIGALHVVQFWLSVESFKSAETTSNLISCDQNESLVSSGVNQYRFGRNQTKTKSTNNVNCHRNTSHSTNSCVAIGNSCDTCSNGEDHCSSSVIQVKSSLPIPNNTSSSDGSEGRSDVVAKQLSIETDAIELYATYIALNANQSISLPDEVRQRVEVSICPEDGRVVQSCLDEAQMFVYQEMENRFFPGFLLSPFLCKYQLEYISSGKLGLLDFLLGENALFYFMEFMEQENATSLIQFWLTAENFKKHLLDPSHQPDIDRDTTDAISIYERYFSLQATEPLFMGDKVRMDIENKICDVQGPRADSYTTAQKIAFDTMNKTYYPSFLKSSIYLRFLNELVHMLNNNETITNTSPTGTSSTQTAGINSSTVDQTDAPGDSPDLDDPDYLWRRPHTSFRLGYVDEYGQYFSEVEPIPAKTSSKQKDNDARRFSWLRKRKDQEELAMKIARNIVTEVLNITQSGITNR